MAAITSDRSAKVVRRASRWVVALFWFVQFAELSLVSLAEGLDQAGKALLPRMIVLCAGILLTLIFVEWALRLDGRTFRYRLIATLIGALVLCLDLVTINFGVFYFFVRPSGSGSGLIEFVYTAFTWSWFFLSIAAAILALSYSFESRDRATKLAEMEAVANDARLTALRYQLNPHFLFNTLNSIAALIDRRQNDEAEQMVENLSDFLRTTLEMDPVQDITLEHELRLQQHYLAIELVRFPTRLITYVDLPPALKRALVPALITQPIIENAIRHAVANSRRPVTVRIGAQRSDEGLEVVIEDDAAANTQKSQKGTGLGIGNVRARLASRFETRGRIDAAAGSTGGYRVVLTMPLRFAA